MEVTTYAQIVTPFLLLSKSIPTTDTERKELTEVCVLENPAKHTFQLSPQSTIPQLMPIVL